MQRYFYICVLLLLFTICHLIKESHSECWTDDAPHMLKCLENEGPPANVSAGATKTCRCRNTCRLVTLRCEPFQNDVDWQFNSTLCLEIDPTVYHDCDWDPNMLMSYGLDKMTHVCKPGYVLHGDIVTTCDNGTYICVNPPSCRPQSHATVIGLSFAVAFLLILSCALLVFIFLNRDSLSSRFPNWIRLSDRTSESC